MNQPSIVPFAFGENLVRVILDEKGDPWFVAKDVALALGYPQTSLSQLNNLLKAVPDEWKGHNQIMTLGGVQEMLTLSEQGLYFFLGRSDKPGALPFQKWMAGDVMPSIRKTGSYAIPMPKPALAAPEPTPPAPLPRTMPDIELPEEALHLRPSMRMRLWQDALQSTRLDGSGIEFAVDCFVKLCTVMAVGPKVKKSPFHEEIREFIKTCCRPTPGTNTRSHDLYEAFRAWRKGHGKDYMPSHKAFSEVMSLFYANIHSNGRWFRDVSLESR